MGMPKDIILVRHGQSEGNLAASAYRSGDLSYVENNDFRELHSSLWRLTDKGIYQASQAGKWIKEHVLTEDDTSFSRYYTSAHLRAMETAGHLNLPNAKWYIELRLIERERGTEDLIHMKNILKLDSYDNSRKESPLYWRPIGGESIADCCARVRNVLDTLSREQDGNRVIIVCHGEIMEAFKVVLERMTVDDHKKWSSSKNPVDRIGNGQIFWYSRENYLTGEIDKHINYFRSVDTYKLAVDTGWKKISRPVMNNTELLRQVENHPRVFEG